ncbi:uncharacterized protein B0I36DRAFT_323389 [Microdochium trichocladiopsis]|uniref:Inhibitor I9 domain-containing protein n=1 Tax=Microdochium trichocladiopsis TaxID=1682393 RepID=A0A9P8Y6S3_9PEZI|nr:uncharacterized protein B0I36DRAFT_323389 [Microdochium trichocladiopsis]KAH7031195.1 hypothetical protein B0I36DRAFT_323389 [Microdochium trichocladiopsis]
MRPLSTWTRRLCSSHPLKHTFRPRPSLPFTTASALKMPTYIITCKEDASPEQVEATKQAAKDQGGQIGHEYKLIKGFSVSFPEGTVHAMDSHEHVKHVEADQEVRTQ